MNISHNRQFCGFVFKFVWAVYGGDLIGFCTSFRKVILKNDQRQTKSKKSQNVHWYEPLWYAHSTALPQSYPVSIGSGAGTPIFKALIGVGNMPSAESGRSRNVLIHLYLVNTRTTYKISTFFIMTPYQIWDQIWKRLAVVISTTCTWLVLQNSKY